MFKKEITFKSFDESETFTETFYFHMTEANILELEASEKGGLSAAIKELQKTSDVQEALVIFKRIIEMSYGILSEDGKKFMKSPQIFQEFASTNAYSELFMELLDADKAAEFINNLVPSHMQERMAEMQAEKDRAAETANQTASEQARAASEARMQGHKQAQQPTRDEGHIEAVVERERGTQNPANFPTVQEQQPPMPAQPTTVGPDETQASPPVQAPAPEEVYDASKPMNHPSQPTFDPTKPQNPAPVTNVNIEQPSTRPHEAVAHPYDDPREGTGPGYVGH